MDVHCDCSFGNLVEDLWSGNRRKQEATRAVPYALLYTEPPLSIPHLPGAHVRPCVQLRKGKVGVSEKRG